MPPPVRESAPARRLRAEDPATPPEALCVLAADANLSVRRAAARNPATPAETLDLLRAAGAAPGLTGTAAPPERLTEDQLNRLAGLGPWARLLVAEHPDAPAELLDRLADGAEPRCRAAVARHPHAPPPLLGRLLLDADPATREAAAGHPAVPPGALGRAVAAGATPDLRGFAAPDALAAAELVALARAGPFGRRLAARHPDTPGSLLGALAADPATAGDLAFNPRAKARHLAGLQDAEDPAVLRALAVHPATPADPLDRLSRSPDARLREAVAERADLPGATRLRLALDGSSAVRAAVYTAGPLPSDAAILLGRAGSAADLLSFIEPDPSLPAEAIRSFAEGGCLGWGRRLAARHPATPPDLLAGLLTHADPTLRAAAASHPAAPAPLLELLVAAGSTPDLHGIDRAREPAGLGGAELVALAALGPWARRLAALHPGTPAHLLNQVASDADASVRRSVARHPSLPEAAMLRLAADEAPDTRWALARRGDLPVAVLRVFAADPLPALRIRAATDPGLPADLLGILRADPDADVREAAQRK